jgi:hypothetical protein
MWLPRLHGREIGAGAECGFQRQTEPFDVANVDLPQADAEVPAC